MKHRPPKEDDQENAEKAFNVIMAFLGEHPEFEGSIWCAAMITSAALAFRDSGHSHEDFKKEMQRITKFYKYLWEE